jgi:hypothetical protein
MSWNGRELGSPKVILKGIPKDSSTTAAGW